MVKPHALFLQSDQLVDMLTALFGGHVSELFILPRGDRHCLADIASANVIDVAAHIGDQNGQIDADQDGKEQGNHTQPGVVHDAGERALCLWFFGAGGVGLKGQSRVGHG